MVTLALADGLVGDGDAEYHQTGIPLHQSLLDGVAHLRTLQRAQSAVYLPVCVNGLGVVRFGQIKAVVGLRRSVAHLRAPGGQQDRQGGECRYDWIVWLHGAVMVCVSETPAGAV